MKDEHNIEYLFERDLLGVQVRIIASSLDSNHESMRAFKLMDCRDCRSYMPHDCNYGIWRGVTPQAALIGTRFGHLELNEYI